MFQYAFLVVWAVAVAGLALAVTLRGGGAERAGVSLLVAGWLLSLGVVQLSPHWVGPHAGLFAVDALFLIGMFVVGLHSRKVWPLVTCGFQLCGICLHIAYWLQPDRWSGAYFVGLQLTSVAVLLAIASGVLGAWRHPAQPSAALSQTHL